VLVRRHGEQGAQQAAGRAARQAVAGAVQCSAAVSVQHSRRLLKRSGRGAPHLAQTCRHDARLFASGTCSLSIWCCSLCTLGVAIQLAATCVDQGVSM
jgi:hypothetical protein